MTEDHYAVRFACIYNLFTNFSLRKLPYFGEKYPGIRNSNITAEHGSTFILNTDSTMRHIFTERSVHFFGQFDWPEEETGSTTLAK